MTSPDWYSNRDIYEMLQAFKERTNDQFAELRNDIRALRDEGHGKKTVWDGIQKWFAVGIAFVSLLYATLRK